MATLIAGPRADFDPSAPAWMPTRQLHQPAHRVAEATFGWVALACGGRRDHGVTVTAGQARDLAAYFCVGCWSKGARR